MTSKSPSSPVAVSYRTETYGFWDGATDVVVPPGMSEWTDLIDHASTHGLALWVHIDPWTIGNAKSRVAAIHNIASRSLHAMESRRVTAEQRVYFRFS
jgi:hypothetical protein